LNENSEIEEFMLSHSVFGADKEVKEMNQYHSPFRSMKRNEELDRFEKMGRTDILRLLLSHPANGLQFTFEKTSGILDEPQRIEYSSVDGKLYLYQYSISATLLDRLQHPVDAGGRNVVLAQDTGTENIIGHGEFTGPAVWVKLIRDEEMPPGFEKVLHRKVLEEAEKTFPKGYTLIVDTGNQKHFDLLSLRGGLFKSSETDRVISTDERGFVLEDTAKEESLGTRRIEYPKVKGLVVYPPKGFSHSGHHLEGVIEANTLCMSADFNEQQNAEQFTEPKKVEIPLAWTRVDETTKQIVEKTGTLKYEVRTSKKPLRIAVDGLNKKAVLHTVE